MISQSQLYRLPGERFDVTGTMVKPPGVLGAHVDAMEICKHIPQKEYPAAALTAALFLVSGIRGMERGTMSNQRDEYGNETYADMELVRLAVPRRVFTLSQIKYVIDRMTWLYENRELVGGTFCGRTTIASFLHGWYGACERLATETVE